MPHISQRGVEMPASPIRKLVPFANKAKAQGKKVYPLNIGQPDIETPEHAFKALKNIDRKILEYSPSEGLLSLREKLSDYYAKFGLTIAAEEIIITTGGSEALFATFLACLDPDDEILITEPTYANYLTFAKACGVKTIPISSSIETGFSLPSIEEIERLITPKTKALLICNPNNPTGYLYTAQEMKQITEIVKKYNLFLISDEVYREFRYTEDAYISALHLDSIQDHVIMVDSVSKRYSECGIRVGMIVTKNPDIRKGIMKWCQARLSPPLLGQIVAEASLNVPEDYLKKVYDEYIERRNLLVEGINRIPGCYSPMPMGAFYTVAKLPVDDSDKFCQWCLEEFSYNNETIFMAPASGFYSTPGKGKNEVRIAYVLNKADLSGALIVLEKALEAYPGRTE